MSHLPWHEAAWRALLAQKGTLPHALLFKGSKGIGKLVFARAFAQALLCETPDPDGDACDGCPSCRWFATDSHPDFRLLEPLKGEEGEDELGESTKKKDAKEIVIKQIRALEDFVGLSSHRNGAKVVLLYPAETLNTSAANALLKTLEEPPPRTYFLLVSHRSRQLLPTVLSRCRQVALPPPRAEQAQDWLRHQGIADPRLGLAQAGYAPLAALELEQGDYWEARRVLLEQLAQHRIDALALAEGSKAEDLPRLLLWLQQWTYDLIFCKFAGKIRYHLDYAEALVRLAKRLDAVMLLRFHRELLRQQRIVQHPLNPRLFAEQLLLSYVRLVET
ncbi:MAG: DNA polymerase III subunit delta' [Pseudomonadota bacterium]